MEPGQRQLREAGGWLLASALAAALARWAAPDALIVIRMGPPLFLGLLGTARAATAPGARGRLLVAGACLLPSLALLAFELRMYAVSME